MKILLIALPLCLGLSVTAWADSTFQMLSNGKILYDQTVVSVVGGVPMKTQEIGVAYGGEIFVCQITLSIINKKSEVSCFTIEDKGLFSIKAN